MARNCEKQYGRLNRVILAKEREEFTKKNPTRPHLSHLHTADEIKQWLPSIKKDLDFNLKQSQVICYPDRKITELRSNVVQLEQDYKRFVRKMKQLDPAIKHVPWTDRPYEPKRAKIQEKQDMYSESTAIPEVHYSIKTPILDTIEPRKVACQAVCDDNLTLQDLPLDFKVMPPRMEGNVCDSEHKNKPSGNSSRFDVKSANDTEQTLKKIFGLTSSKMEIGRKPAKLNLVGYTSNSDSSDNSD